MNVLVELHYVIKFCKYYEAILLLQDVFGNRVLGLSTIKKQHKMFQGGVELSEFELWGGKPKTVHTVTNINTIATAIEEDCHQSVQALTTELKIS